MLLVSLLCGSVVVPPTFAADPPAKPTVSATVKRPKLTVRQMLNARLPEVKFENVPLADAIDFLRDVSGANIHVNWRALETAGVARDVVITTKLRKVPVRKVLSVILAQASAEANTLAFYNDGGVIEVTTTEIADAQLITRTYFVGDIIMNVPDFAGPTMSLTSRSSGTGGGNRGGGGSGSGGIFEKTDTDKNQGTTKAERADNLVTLITKVVRPEVWEANGGKATISYFNGYIIVTAPRSAHELLAGPVD
jgi:hypothetical protein